MGCIRWRSWRREELRTSHTVRCALTGMYGGFKTVSDIPRAERDTRPRLLQCSCWNEGCSHLALALLSHQPESVRLDGLADLHKRVKEEKENGEWK